MLKEFSAVLVIAIFFACNLYSQQYRWRTLPNSPSAGSRFNDCSFINPNTGWVCSADNANIFKTTNGGATWFIVGVTGNSNRCIAFFDSLRGWTGEYNSTNRFNKTTNGGVTWQVISIPPPVSTGLCGFSIVSDSILYGCGRYWGPARVVKTINGGNSWQNIDMSGYASGLVDCKFFNSDSGFVVGRGSQNGASIGIILSTSDGGKSWDTSYVTKNVYQWCWKISFPTNNVGYVSLEPASSGVCYFLKTTNRGVSWEEKVFLNTSFDEEGIGFINATTGWIGGWENTTYETTNGGDNWHLLDTVGTGSHVKNINRFRFFSDTLGYAVGYRIYKYSRDIMTSVSPISNFGIYDFRLYQNYPNPFNPRTQIKINLPHDANISLTIYNILGNQIATIIEGDYLSAGAHQFEWDASDYPSGVYYYKLYNKDIEITKSMLLIK